MMVQQMFKSQQPAHGNKCPTHALFKSKEMSETLTRSKEMHKTLSVSKTIEIKGKLQTLSKSWAYDIRTNLKYAHCTVCENARLIMASKRVTCVRLKAENITKLVHDNVEVLDVCTQLCQCSNSYVFVTGSVIRLATSSVQH